MEAHAALQKSEQKESKREQVTTFQCIGDHNMHNMERSNQISSRRA